MAGTATSRLEESGDQAPHSIRWRQLSPASTSREHLECGEFSPLFGPGTCHRPPRKESAMGFEEWLGRRQVAWKKAVSPSPHSKARNTCRIEAVPGHELVDRSVNVHG